MIDELTKTFFDTFGIEPKYRDYRVKNGKEYESKNPNNRNIRLCYPQITDTHYLQLICELSGVCCPHFAFERDISELKETILKFCIHYKDHLEKSVQALFEEG